MLGGKSVGKSLVLADFEKKLNEKVGFCPLLVDDARGISGAPLTTGILRAYKSMALVRREDNSLTFLKTMVEALGSVVSSSAELSRLLKLINAEDSPPPKELVRGFGTVLDVLIKSKEVSGEEALEAFTKLAKL